MWFDIRAVVEGFADQLVLINDEHCRQIALAKARLDAEVDALKREMASVKLDFEDFKTHKVPRRLSLGLQGGLSESSDVIDQFMSQLADTHAEYATKLAQVKEEFDREIAALRQELILFPIPLGYLANTSSISSIDKPALARRKITD